MKANKFVEADKLAADGEAKLQTSWIKWSADVDGAIVDFEAAANAYRSAGALPKARDIFKRLSQLKLQNNSAFGAAKHTENAASVSKEMKDFKEASALYEHAAELHARGGTPEKGASALQLAAKMSEAMDDATRAVELYKRACDWLETDSKEQFGLECFRAAIACAIRYQKLSDAIELMKMQISAYEKLKRSNESFKSYLALLVLHLAASDLVAAMRSYDTFSQYRKPGFVTTDEAMCAMDLLQAFEEMDEARLKKCISNQTFEFLDPPVARMARALKLIQKKESTLT